jgi:excisionase family DNA binding protein
MQLSISKSKLYQMVEREEIQYRRIGGAIRFSPEDVDAVLNDCKKVKRERRDAVPQRKAPRRPRLRELKL